MSRIIGYFTVAAAIVLIACSAQSLFTSAYESATELWQQRIQGTQIVAVICWEAGAVLAIGYCWRHGQRLLALGGTVLLLLAMAYTFSAELRLQAGTQENAVASRTAHAGRIELVKQELDKAIARRDYLQSIRKPTDAQQDELISIRRDVERLKDAWEPLVETTHSAGIPGAALIARWTGININDAGDIDAIIKMFFWTMVRVFALPIALSGVSLIGAERKPSGLQQPNVTSTPLPAVSVRPRQPMVALERISGVNLAVTASNSADTIACEPNLAQTPALPTDPTDGGTPVDVRPVEHSEMSVSPNVVKTDGTPYQHPKHSLKNLRGNVRVWKDERLERTALAGGGATTGALHDDYTRWCALRGHVALHKGPFGKALNKLGMKRVGKVAGSFRPGWVLKTEIAIKSRKAA
jgi:hypothetical protein